MHSKNFLVVLLTIFSLNYGIANATVINFQFIGTVTYGGTLAAVGSQVKGAFSYDTSLLPWFSYEASDGSCAFYSYTSPEGISGNVEGHTMNSSNIYISIWDGIGSESSDGVDLHGGYPVTVDGILYPDGVFGFHLSSKPGSSNVLASTALPSLLDASAFDAGISMTCGSLQSDGGPDGQMLQFSIDSITSDYQGEAPIPEPTSLLLLGTGILSLTGIRKKFRYRIASQKAKSKT
jgi:hypothetical protein